MIHIDLNLTSDVENKFLHLIENQFEGSFEGFIKKSINLYFSDSSTVGDKLSAHLLKPELGVDDNLFARDYETSRDIDL